MAVTMAADEQLAAEAVELAASLAASAAADGRITRAQRRRSGRMARLMEDPRGTSFTLALTDEVLRIDDRRRAALRFRSLVEDGGLPSFLGPVDRLLLKAGATLAPRLPGVVMPLVERRLRAESGGVILPAERGPLARHIARRTAAGFDLNVSLLGEAILGEREAQRRLDDVLELLARPEIDYVSVKISSICSQLDVLAFDASVDRIAARLRPLYAAAQGHRPAKFVNLDMEEYRDLHLTAAVFRRVLDEPGFLGLDAGIVLQAYLPDSFGVLRELTSWAEARRARGGGRIKVRLVKGANLAMEQVEAEMHGWPQAPYTTKAEVDANYKRMLDLVLDGRYADSVRVGVASHNLFDVAWALTQLSASGSASGAGAGAEAGAGASDRVELEMLEGMAEPQARAVRDLAGRLLLYAPIARHDDFESTIAYLVRRLDENTAPENFLRQVFSFRAGSPGFDVERDRFLAAVHDRHDVSSSPRRQQDRSTEQRSFDPDAPFANEPDTDFTIAANRTWITDALAAWPPTGVGSSPPDPASVPGPPDVAAVDAAMARAVAAQRTWGATAFAERRQVLCRVAEVMAAQRGRTIAGMAHEAGKVVGEGDVEVSEAIDFARWYADSTRTVEALLDDGLTFDPFGVVVVASPWNFPYAIPSGGVLAALAAGNTVILKPAPETRHTAWLIATQCWEAGVPPDVLQFLPCDDDDAGRRLVTHPEVGVVILTGAWETAQLFRSWRPDLRLFAETSGKNAIVVTAAGDLDAAVRDIVRSAFGHAGQKCSAASLAIVEAGVYDDPAFRDRLSDAVASLRVGPAWDVSTTVGPLIRPPEGPLAEALTTLDAGESWLVEPRLLDPAPAGTGEHPGSAGVDGRGASDGRGAGEGVRWTPGVKLGVRPGSRFHLTECFGPVLGVMRADDLDHAVELQNMPLFGLTGGIHSLDEREVDRWLEGVEVGNAYVNRPITGAIVRRQPFGGWKRSVVGAGAKAGGPNYVLTLGTWHSPPPPTPRADVPGHDFDRWWRDEFAGEHDPSGLRAESNVLRYRPLPHGVLLRAGSDVADAEVMLAVAAARTTGVRLTISSESPRPAAARSAEADVVVVVVVETAAELAARLPDLRVDRLRIPGHVPDELRATAHAAGLTLDDAPVVAQGRVELLHWLREQAISRTLHRYGNIPGPS